ncbi:hypothetical protein SBD_6348 [Streptomyces bottropensis ATCC 25435]|uniref:Uncharacterized protein n=1 Tax=Streptomyces bottropensis ATCC 25435 TaxID=1054862 RepID=M3E6U9_9ACTN|nr:hypothetical protein SBD_6348 [Streptomyces bottropensis ATCC 25435]
MDVGHAHHLLARPRDGSRVQAPPRGPPTHGERPPGRNAVPPPARPMPPRLMRALARGRRECAPAPPDGWFSVPWRVVGDADNGHALGAEDIGGPGGGGRT